MPIGPQLPPSVLEKRKHVDDNPDQIPVSDSDSSRSPSPETSVKRQRLVGPSLPPGAAEDPVTLSFSTTQPTRTPRIAGPTLPPAPLDERPSLPAAPIPQADASSGDSDEDDDDDYGPSLPPPSGSTSSDRALPSTTTTQTAPSNEPQRDEWMTLAPSNSDWSSRSVDPTKLKNRRFATNPRTGGAPATSNTTGPNAWHETLAEKQERLRREVLGISTPASTNPTPTASTAHTKSDGIKAKKDAVTAKRLQEYHAQRGGSLYETHGDKKVGKEEEDDPSKRAFDYEKDIAGGAQINSTQKREMMKKMKDMGGRFEKATYL